MAFRRPYGCRSTFCSSSASTFRQKSLNFAYCSFGIRWLESTVSSRIRTVGPSTVTLRVNEPNASFSSASSGRLTGFRAGSR
jgi:hypothetical protein